MDDFWRNVTRQPAVQRATEAAATAAAQVNGFLGDNFPHHQQQQQQQQNQQQQEQPPSGPPPASTAALRQLPTISVTAEDLVEPSNRECCICFDENNIHDKVVRLPCAHIFHSRCITDWLGRHCTCPTCRYELPTDDSQYEAGRRERMKQRKPRFAKYELERMSIRELKALMSRRLSSAMFSDKRDLVEYLISNEIVDLISKPPPVEFPSRAVLRAMGVGQLKRTMNESGVYFDPKDVVEKEDMVQIFVNSGRICLAEEDEPNGDDQENRGPDTGYGHTAFDRPQTFSAKNIGEKGSDTGSNDTNRSDRNENTQQDGNGDEKPLVGATESTPTSSIVVETVDENDDDTVASTPKKSRAARNNKSPGEWHSTMVMEEASSFFEPPDDTTNTTTTKPAPPAEASSVGGEQHELPTENNSNPGEQQSTDTPGLQKNDNNDPMGTPASSTSAFVSMEALDQDNNGDSDVEMEDVSEAERKLPPRDERMEGQFGDAEEEDSADSNAEDRTNQFRNLSISEMRTMAQEQGIDLSHCIERSEMIERLSASQSVARSVSAAATNESDSAEWEDVNDGDNSQSSNNNRGLSAEVFQTWSDSNLRACASAAEVDLSRCTTHEDIVTALLKAAVERPHVASYLAALSPLMGMKTSELRVLARHRHIKISHCLEKGEMIRVLATASQWSSV